ncbi:MAG: InlB B-repeat-containing protein [Synergistaceae bacterium]|nr:InlB B-repeat-containing protein [Synergistaceae bacterium]
MKKRIIKSLSFWSTAITVVIFLSCILLIEPARAEVNMWPDVVKGDPRVVDGRTLTKKMAGDTSDWVEIARNGEYSLILRKNFLNISSNNAGNLQYQYITYGATSIYEHSSARTYINDWFNNRVTGGADSLPANARLRDYAVYSYGTLSKRIGSVAESQSLTDGYSKPTTYQVGEGDDIAFALSFGEAANFCSMEYYNKTSGYKGSNATAIENFRKINMPTTAPYGMWLRSPGNLSEKAGAMLHSGSVHQFNITTNNGERGIIYPAMWVKSKIFEDVTRRKSIKLNTISIADGRILSKDRTGDTKSNWVEIATMKDKSGKVSYSLIVREKNIVINEGRHKEDPNWNRTDFGKNDNEKSNYNKSYVRNFINTWFNSELVGSADILSEDARIRKHAVYSDAKHNLGSGCAPSSIGSGWSVPTIYKKGVGEDSAFALSYGEAASFCSNSRYEYDSSVAIIPSDPLAQKNYKKIDMPTDYLFGMWLRSPGDKIGKAAAIGNGHSGSYTNGTVFQFQVHVEQVNGHYSEYGLVYPAVWVGDGIFYDDMSVTYHPNGGIGDTVSDDVVYGDYYTIRSPESDDLNFTRGGHSFKFWSDYPQEEDDNEYYDPDEEIFITRSMNLYAHWELNVFEVKYHNTDTGEVYSDYAEYNRKYNILGEVFSKKGYSITKWITDDGKSYLPGDEITIDNDIVLYTNWEPNTQTVKYYNTENGEVYTEYVKYDDEYKIRGDVFEKKGYIIVEWKTSDGKSYLPGEDIIIDDDVVLFTHWEPKPQTVKYYNTENGDISTDYVKYDDEYRILDNVFEKKGYSIVEWKTSDGKSYLPGEDIIIDDDIVLFTHWEPNPHTITYYPNVGTEGAIIDDVVYDEMYNIRNQAFTMNGFSIVEWNTKPDGSGVSYLPGLGITIEGSVELYAQWKPNAFTVTYHPNGGIGESVIDPTFFGNLYKIKDQGYTRPYYQFDGWNTRADGLGLNYTVNQSYTMTGSLVLYAKWIPKI